MEISDLVVTLLPKINQSPGRSRPKTGLRSYLADSELVRSAGSALPSRHHTVIHRVLLEKPFRRGGWLEANLGLRLEGNLDIGDEVLKQSTRIASRHARDESWMKAQLLIWKRQLVTRRQLVPEDEFAIPETFTELCRENYQNMSTGFDSVDCHVREPG